MDMSSNDKARPIRLVLFESEPRECPYLPGRTAVDQFGPLDDLEPWLYERLMDQGFRRSGRMIYRPVCNGCRECQPLRVPIQEFRPTRSQRRVWRRNADVHVSMGPPQSTDEKYQLFRKYLDTQHDGRMIEDREGFDLFLYDSVTDTREMVYSVDGRIIGVGIVDVCPACISSVYFYFDPAESRRSLGVYSVLREIEWCRSMQLAWWYAGFFVRDCPRMNYKAAFRPYELLGPDEQWARTSGD